MTASPSDWRIEQGKDMLAEAKRQRPDVDYMRATIRGGADTNVTDKDGNSLLLLVSTWGNIEIIRDLLDHGADVNHQGRAGNTALHLLVASGNKEIVSLLLKRGADASIRNAQGKTAGECAKDWDEPEMAKKLGRRAGEIEAARNAVQERFNRAVEGGLPVEEAFPPLKPLRFKPR